MDIRPEWIGFGYAFVSMGGAPTRPDCSWVGHGYNIVPMDIPKPAPIVCLNGEKNVLSLPHGHMSHDYFTLFFSKTCIRNYTIPIVTFIS